MENTDMPRPETECVSAPPPAWEVYFVRCRDGSLYTGIARDAEKRLAVHNSGHGAKYTRSRLPVMLVYRESCADHSAALRREIALKKLSRAEKEALIALQTVHESRVLAVLLGTAGD